MAVAFCEGIAPLCRQNLQKEFELKQSSKPAITFLGIGLMGKPMATRLLEAGYQVTAWNRTHGKADELATFGAKVEAQVTDAVCSADIVITMLEAGPIVARVIDAALPDLRPGTLVIDMSSTRQSEAQELHARLAAKEIRFIDAPVSGGVVGAQAGSLAIMAGGDAKDFAEAEPVLAVMGRPTLVGPAGCGQIAKLCNQLIVGGTLNIVAEALLLAQAGGADPAAVRTAIRGGFAESRILEVHGQRMLERNFLPGGQVKSQHKDLENVLIAANNAGLQLPVTELVTKNYQSVLKQVPQADQSAVLLTLEQGNPGLRLGDAADQLPG
ncbi:MAG TPA: NAD(P)-dependent oxidoreductase [Oxalicibacterium sp.]|uniref:NAD(P)-dependent oxidoreductase n=1 Tax=Oxalicibacterium sp. TaxID=2766525 RepID=UPI002B8A62EC|nr:NAD(P)-dependent oxidoreductase [Oxalicibacterium sp.]HWU98793.1 NAD(P)-dependent oxidoreductase [Oxalicibacterium sp.]